MNQAKTYTLGEIAKHIGAELDCANVSDAHSLPILGLATLSSATREQIAFLANSKYKQQLQTTNAGAVIISPDDKQECTGPALVMKNPYMGYALAAQLLDSTPKPANSIHNSAVISNSAVVGENVSIGPNVVIEDGVVIGEHVSIGAGTFIGKNVQIGANTTIWANVTIYHRVIIGQHCLVHANTVIGADGFGYANEGGQWLKIPQLGSVIIGNSVEIGSSTTIDRGALEDTIIKDGVILDNQIQIAHNVIIGENTAIAACSVIAGSTTIGKNCTIAGMVAVTGHATIADGVIFTGMTMVTKSINKAGVYSSGMPCVANKEWHKSNARIRKLSTLNDRVKVLEKHFSERD